MAHSTIRLYILISTCWKIRDRRKIKNRHKKLYITQKKYTHKTTLV